ncbi:sodium-coupled monocarboxylate transporter 2-like [Phlebotomus argentipes]|uniref:sodium-coupled monocarboxylate transporter 2-like n=1 Tax=Phlebotomus argentipes TaxID=94469 RepID=UPI0028930030|nr:sodium-coupled monocarboxylate transporter 2-like [Phlebotomus argentipes]
MIASAVVQFSVLDYFCFAIVFIVSLSIGIHYAILARKRGSNIEDYLLGGRNMKLVPVSFSLVATAVSGATVVGHITETYAYGLTMWMFIVIAMIRLVVIQYIFLPVFYELQLLSSFSYLEQRFDRTVKKIASAMYLVAGIIFMPIVIYVPALAFQRVSGLNLYVIAATITVLCIVYTAIGGIKAVVWTDVFQLVLILTSSIVIMIVGFNNVGGMRNVWEALDRGGRLVFVKLDLDLEERGTIWGYLFSLIFASIYHMGLSQSSIQRYTALPTLQKAKQSLWIQFGVYMIIILTDLAIGSIMYAAYEDCDPFSAGLIAKIDQTLPHFVQERASLFPGFNGIFIAGIFAP